MLRKLRNTKKGQGMVEYAILLAAIALVCIGVVSLLGTKTADLIGGMAVVIPGADAVENGPVQTGQLVELADYTGPGDVITVDWDLIDLASGTNRFAINMFNATYIAAIDSLLVDP